MKNQNIVFIAIAFALAFALAPTSAEAVRCDSCPVITITIHSAGDILRGKTGSFVLEAKVSRPGFPFGGAYVNFSVSGTAVAGVDYVALLSPAYIGPAYPGQSGFGVMSLKTLPDPRAASNRQAYSVVVTLEPGAGYSVGEPSSAEIWIQP